MNKQLTDSTIVLRYLVGTTALRCSFTLIYINHKEGPDTLIFHPVRNGCEGFAPKRHVVKFFRLLQITNSSLVTKFSISMKIISRRKKDCVCKKGAYHLYLIKVQADPK